MNSFRLEDKNGNGLWAGEFPPYKKPCLFSVEGNILTKIASFNGEEGLELFRQFCLKFAREEQSNEKQSR